MDEAARAERLLTLAEKAIETENPERLMPEAACVVAQLLGIPDQHVVVWRPSQRPDPTGRAPLALSVPVEAHGEVVARVAVLAPAAGRLPDAAPHIVDQVAAIVGAAYERQHEVLRERERVEGAQARERLLAHASVLLTAHEGPVEAATRTAALCVPAIADLCLVDLLVEGHDGTRIERVAAEGASPLEEETVAELASRYPRATNPASAAPQVIETGRPILYETVSDALPRRAAEDERHLEILRSLGTMSYLCVPLATAESRIGALGLICAASGRRYTHRDVATVRAIAGQAALAIQVAHSRRQARDSVLRGPILTHRQAEVLAQAAQGMTNEQIARAMSLSHGAIKKHLAAAMARLGASDRRSAVVAARSLDLIGSS